MPKIKLTKTELKKQRDMLKQFTRFLPTLQLKKQQLQMEMRSCQARLDKNREARDDLNGQLDSWIALFGTEGTVEKLTGLVNLNKIEMEWHNVAGVEVPVFVSADFEISAYDLFLEDAWIDDAVENIRKLIELRAEAEIIQEQYRLLGHELRVTTQRVNLFEKVKIPEAKESIRVIQIYLGDMETAAVGRSKIAKKKSQEAAA